jgi:hypothetical protein
MVLCFVIVCLFCLKVKVCSRDSDTGQEDLVDDFLHAQILEALMGRSHTRDHPGENTLVICTGDQLILE